MFKVYELNSNLASSLDNLQDKYQINAVTNFGKDSQYITYVLVDYEEKNAAPLSGSVPVHEVDDTDNPPDTSK